MIKAETRHYNKPNVKKTKNKAKYFTFSLVVTTSFPKIASIRGFINISINLKPFHYEKSFYYHYANSLLYTFDNS